MIEAIRLAQDNHEKNSAKLSGLKLMAGEIHEKQSQVISETFSLYNPKIYYFYLVKFL